MMRARRKTWKRNFKSGSPLAPSSNWQKLRAGKPAEARLWLRFECWRCPVMLRLPASGSWCRHISFRPEQLDAFKHVDRKFPVYFPYAFGEVDSGDDQGPGRIYAGDCSATAVDALALMPGIKTWSSLTGSNWSRKGSCQSTEYSLMWKYIPEIKDFFGKVQAGDEQQAVLQWRQYQCSKKQLTHFLLRLSCMNLLPACRRVRGVPDWLRSRGPATGQDLRR